MSEIFAKRLETEQPVVYQTLRNSFQNDRVAHAYLFSGLAGTPKMETAVLLAQSLVCEHKEVFACEKCETCLRIKDGNYADIIYVDGKEKQIKVDDIRRVIEEFNKTGLEGYNKKIYIIDYVENCNDVALNTLLKFLEEPAGASVYAILLTEQIDRILPTIISRCQTIQFKPLSSEICYNVCVENGFDPFDSYLLSRMYRDTNMIQEVHESANYQKAKEIFTNFVNNLSVNKDEARLGLMMDLDFMPSPSYSKSETDKTRSVLSLFMKLNSIFFNDLAFDFKYDIEWYKEKQEEFKNSKYNSSDTVKLFREAENKLSPSDAFNLPLVVDQLLYRL